MKKSLLALVVLGSFAGAASAASSVTLYGKVQAAYQKSTGSSLTQGSAGESRLGIKVKEDLGNGLAAFAQLEAKFDGDTGASNGSEFFGEKAVVGLSSGAHSVYFGRSASPIDRIGMSMDHLSSGLGWKSSAGNWVNGAFYDYNANGLSVAAGATTKGGYNNSAEGSSSAKASYGASVKYAASNFAVAAGYQADNDTAAVKNEFGVGAQYTFNPVTVAVSYASAKLGATNSVAALGKERRLHATISAKVTSADTLFVNYLNDKTKTAGGLTAAKLDHFGLGYIHSMSKRTEVFANVGRNRDRLAGTSATGWDIGLRHSF